MKLCFFFIYIFMWLIKSPIDGKYHCHIKSWTHSTRMSSIVRFLNFCWAIVIKIKSSISYLSYCLLAIQSFFTIFLQKTKFQWNWMKIYAKNCHTNFSHHELWKRNCQHSAFIPELIVSKIFRLELSLKEATLCFSFC